MVPGTRFYQLKTAVTNWTGEKHGLTPPNADVLILKALTQFLSFSSQCLLSDGSLPSGKNVEDYDNNLLNQMFQYLKGRTS